MATAAKTNTIVVLGAANCGKTAIINTFVTGEHHSSRLIPTIEDMYRKVLTSARTIEIIDTAGEESIIDLMREFYKAAGAGFLLVYNVASIDSWLRMVKEYEQFKRHNKPIIIVGSFTESQPSDRKIEYQQLAAFGLKHNCRVFETSITDAVTISRIFIQMQLEIDNTSTVPQLGDTEKRPKCCCLCC